MDGKHVPKGAGAVEVQAPGSLLFGVGASAAVGVGEPLPLEAWHKVRIAHGTVIGKADWRFPPSSLPAPATRGTRNASERPSSNTT